MRTLREHWPEYGMEAAGLAIFMIAACVFTVILEHPGSPVRQAIGEPLARRGLMGLAMGSTAVAIIYSRWGKRSGAHLNPAVTLGFWRLGKIDSRDAVFYALAQFAGGAAGVLLAAVFLRDFAAHPAVAYAATVPGPRGPWIAFAAEVAISFALLLAVLWASNRPGLNRFTGLLAGALVALWITIEAPLSGMSMNPARTLGSAVPAGQWTALWIYFTAPPLGMLLATEVYRRASGAVRCAKLHHENLERCIFRCNWGACASGSGGNAMSRTGHDWAIVLAAGDGTRLRSLTTDTRGITVPKQFSALAGQGTLFEQAMRRAGRVVLPGRIVPVVASRHRGWWERELAHRPEVRPVVQPQNRGTAAGVLLPLLRVMREDPDAAVYLVPSDHYVADEAALGAAAARALVEVRRDPSRIVLLGITPDAPDPEYGWIVPGATTVGGLREIRAFLEKPTPAIAAGLMARGGVWSSFLIVASARALHALYARRLPALVAAFEEAGAGEAFDPPAAALETLYAGLDASDFSRELLQGAGETLRLLAVPECGWSDLGTPERVANAMRRLPAAPPRPSLSPSRAPRRPMRAPVDLVAALAAHGAAS